MGAGLPAQKMAQGRSLPGSGWQMLDSAPQAFGESAVWAEMRGSGCSTRPAWHDPGLGVRVTL